MSHQAKGMTDAKPNAQNLPVKSIAFSNELSATNRKFLKNLFEKELISDSS
jgi:hypothetical protein